MLSTRIKIVTLPGGDSALSSAAATTLLAATGWRKETLWKKEAHILLNEAVKCGLVRMPGGPAWVDQDAISCYGLTDPGKEWGSHEGEIMGLYPMYSWLWCTAEEASSLLAEYVAQLRAWAKSEGVRLPS